MEEPSVLDYLKARLNPRGQKLTAFSFEAPETPPQPEQEGKPAPKDAAFAWPWRALAAVALALGAQSMLEPPERNLELALAFYGLAAAFLIWAILRKEWLLADLPPAQGGPLPLQVNTNAFLMSLPLMLLAFLAFGGNRFNLLNLFLWGLALFYGLMGLWHRPPDGKAKAGLFRRAAEFFKKPRLNISISAWTLLLAAALGMVFFFRFAQLDRIPGEMFSDHAEKLLDVADVLDGEYSIFFPRNTGREAFQMYLTAAVALLFNSGLTFMSLKIGTALAGFFTLPFIYLLGKEIGNRWVGLLAFLLAGIAYWPNVISRVGLRFPLYPLLVAPALFFLIRGLKTSNRNDFLLSGLALGIGLHGYSPARFLPFVLILAVVLYILHGQSKGNRLPVVWALAALAFVSFIVFLPLLRYALENPEMFGYRALTRLGTAERPFPAPVWEIFLGNLWSAWVMFFWKNGEIWVHSIPGRPALDVVTAVFYLLGSVQLLVRYLRRRHWLDLFLILAVPALMMPSILSLAFPDENPSLNRTGGAIVPVFLIAALAFEGLLAGLHRRASSAWGRSLAVGLGLGLLLLSAGQNYELVFRQYKTQFLAGAWNTSEIGRAIRGYAESIGDADTAYVVPYPHWVDTRLVGINAGYPLKDYALWPEQFSDTVDDRRTKLFVVKPEDSASIELLRGFYPDGSLWLHKSVLEGKDFYLYFAPPGKP